LQARFITFEGGEGSGKSTQSKLLQAYFDKHNISSILTREPGGTENAEAIRELLVTGDGNRWDKISETLLFYAARRDHVENLIKPKLSAGANVICDRFNDSTIAYQGYGHGLDVAQINAVAKLVIGDFKPSITFIIDIPAEEGLKRSKARLQGVSSNEDRFEQIGLEFHQRLREGFHAIAKADPERCKLVNGMRSIEEIHAEILNLLGFNPS
jgi:dTMP kinase